MPEILSDFPKLQCPFIRQTFKTSGTDFKKYRSTYNLRNPEAYLVIDQVNPGYEWVFDDKETFAVEKLDGTNVKIKTEAGKLVVLQNRKNILEPLQIVKGQTQFLEGILRASSKGYIKEDGEQAGELIGPKLQGNPYKLESHLWYPFEKTITDLKYKSFDEHERNYDNWSLWLKDYLHSRFYAKLALKHGRTDKMFAEGVVFYNLRRRAENKTWMAKLRRNMFPWFYEGVEFIG